MNALAILFPSSKNILCIWHIEKNILGNVRKHFLAGSEGHVAFDLFMKEYWRAVVNAATEERYREAVRTLSYFSPSEAFNYIEQQWLPYKERFVKAWLKNIDHFGHTSSHRLKTASTS